MNIVVDSALDFCCKNVQLMEIDANKTKRKRESSTLGNDTRTLDKSKHTSDNEEFLEGFIHLRQKQRIGTYFIPVNEHPLFTNTGK